MSLVSDIPRLILEQGSAQAEGLRRRGALVGGTLASIGQTVAAIPAIIQQKKLQAQENEVRGLQLQSFKGDLAEKEQARVRHAKVEQILSQYPDIEQAIPEVMKVDPAAGSALSEHVNRARKEGFDEYERQQKFITSQLQQVHDQGTLTSKLYTLKHAFPNQNWSDIPEDYESAKPVLSERILSSLSPEKRAELDLKSRDTAAREMRAAREARPPQPTIPALALQAAGGDPQGAIDIVQGPAKAAAERAAANTAADNARADAALAISRAHLALAKNREAGEGAVPKLTPEGKDAVALNFAKTGQLPPMGYGKAAVELRTEIINRAAEMNPNLDLASNRADYKANQGALSQLQKQRDAIGAFEQTAQKNIDLFLTQAGKVVDTGSPLANKLVRQVTGQMLGSPDQAAYNAARQVAINEIAKITTNPNLSGQLSDTARKEVEAFNPGSATLKQSVSVMRLLKQDMQNRTIALDDQISAIKGRISGKAAPALTPTMRYNPATGKVEPIK